MADPPRPRIVHRDTQPPAFKTLTPVRDVALAAEPPDGAGLTDGGARRPARPAPTARIVGVSSNEPNDGDDDNNTSKWEITGPRTVNLRAERSGVGMGRIYGGGK